MAKKKRGDSKNNLTDALLPLEKAEQLKYPSLVSAFLDYYATGEGRTTGLFVMRANSAVEFRKEVENEWGEYYSQGVLVRIWCGVPTEYELQYPHSVDALLRQYGSLPATFKYSSTLHFNLA